MMCWHPEMTVNRLTRICGRSFAVEKWFTFKSSSLLLAGEATGQQQGVHIRRERLKHLTMTCFHAHHHIANEMSHDLRSNSSTEIHSKNKSVAEDASHF